ncbi:MAG TPA: hypothetical protein DCZ10_09220 [Pelotomaculum sp.]|nr:hypothetical protein [Pelotomaculum sp.]
MVRKTISALYLETVKRPGINQLNKLCKALNANPETINSAVATIRNKFTLILPGSHIAA